MACTHRPVACNPPRTGVYGLQRGLEVKLTRIGGRLALVGLLCFLAACGDGGGEASSSNVGTLAYVVSSCREVAGEATLQQELRIFHGKGETVTALSVGPLGPFTSYGLCARLGKERAPIKGLLGAFQRLGVTPDGSGVVFELTDEFASVGQGVLPAAQRGIYYVRPDGSDLRRLGPASRVPGVLFVPPDSSYPTGGFFFDPGGRQFTYPDLGPDDTGEEAPQVFVQRLATGERRQLTRLPRIAQAGEPPDIVVLPGFIDQHTILFYRFLGPPDRLTALSVDTLDLHLSDVPTVALPGGTLIPILHIIGGEWQASGATIEGEAVNPVPPNWSSVAEVFVTDGTNVLQLTDFRRVDTTLQPYFSPRDQRVYFTASADPLGRNPSHDCQIFSVEPLTRDLRQVTSFHEGGDRTAACRGGKQGDGCSFGLVGQNGVAGTIYFMSQCDPLGLNPNGRQLFAIQPDGTGLQQVTNARGFVRGAGRTMEVETVEDQSRYAPPR